ncbi:MAG: cytochrome c [Rhodobacterales bacterium]|nr:cytochrome c [Rhodobacterales bacterium]
MKYLLGFGLAAVFGIGALVLWQTQASQAQGESGGFLPYQDAERVASGATVYTYYCASCHGLDLSGEANWRSPDEDGYLPAPPHDQTGHTWHHPDEQLFLTVKYGTEKLVGGNYKSRMDGYGSILTDNEIMDVLAFIKSRWPAPVVKRHNQVNGG